MPTDQEISKKDQILRKQKEYLFPNHILYYSEPLPLDHGEGSYIWDVDGNKYLDFFAGILTTSVGHNRPEVNQKIQKQANGLIHTSTLYPNEQHANLAEKLAQIAPGQIKVSYFFASGTEADEAASLLAKTHTGSEEIIALRHGYSGRSAVGMALTGQSSWRLGGTHVPWVKHALNPYCYRCPLKMTYPSCGVACADDIEDVIKTTTSGEIAGFIMEPIQGVGGFITPPKEYAKIAYDIIKHYGGLFISDEVQTGFGRTGKHWFGIEHSEVEPDIMTMAKGIANGMPLANLMTNSEIAESTSHSGLTITTFGGNPVSCAAAIGVLEVLKQEAGPDRSEHLGKILRLGLEKLQTKYDMIGDVRGMGLMQGLELVDDRETREPAPQKANDLMEATRKQGLLIGKGGLYGNVMRIAPPLTTTEDEVIECIDKLDKAFNSMK